ncbi:MAG: CopK family periplasmic copper-binding protein [Polaromonas sp.]
MKKLLIITLLGTAAISAFAVDSSLVDKSIPLANGATVYILKNGKMAMEDNLGRVVRMKQNEVMVTKDGQKIMMHGDEVAVLSSIKNIENRR